MPTRLIFILVVCVGLAASDTKAQTGSIEGIVLGEDGEPVVGAVVLYNNVPELSRDNEGRMTRIGPAVNSGVITDLSGRFLIASGVST